MRVMIADDHAMVRDGLRPFLEMLGDEVDVVDAASLDEVMDIAGARPLDLLLLDIEMPGMHGPETVAEVCRRLPETRVVVISGHSDRAAVITSMEAGAMGFLPKSLHADSLLHALRLILSDGSYFPGEVLLAPQEACPRGGAAGSNLEHLTLREREIAAKVARGASNKEIGRDLGLTDVTVKSHLRNIYRKIGVQNRTQCAAVVLEEQARR